MKWEEKTMTSRTPYFNKTLFKKNILGVWPLWGVAGLLGVVVSLGILNINLYDETRFFNSVFELSPIINVVLAMIYAMLCALLVWKYLFSEKSDVFFHSLPVKREGLFLTNYLSGFVIMLIPYVCVGATVVISSLVHHAFDAGVVLRTVLIVLGENLFFFSLASFVVFLVGHLASFIAVYLAANFLAVLFELVITGLARGFWVGYDTVYNAYARFLSPCVHMIAELEESGNWVVAAYAAVGVALSVAAMLLYRGRNSESAGEIVAIRVLRPIFKYAFAIVIGMLGGNILYSLLYLFDSDSAYRFLPMLICELLMGAIGYFAAQMLLEKTVRVFKKKNMTGFILVSAVLILICGSFKMDFFGVENRTAKAEDIKCIEMMAVGARCEAGQDDSDRLRKILDFHEVILENKEDIRFADDTSLWTLSDYRGNTVRFVYTLKNGEVFERQYIFRPGNEAIYNAYENIMKDTEVKRGFFSTEGVKITNIELFQMAGEGAESTYEQTSVHHVDYNRILNALYKEADKIEFFSGDDYALIMNISSEKAKNSDYYDYYYLSIVITPDMKNVVEELIRTGLLANENGTLKLIDEEYGHSQK
ncbi:MAG: hypothetical protein IKR26_04810 [Lachnospiraceae bacterium]|nr:hypothetical protein [Lachnospiraceae bacterium]